jgi:protein-histidine pros-kinase
MVIVDTKGEIVLANAPTERLFGYAREELVGRPVETLIPSRYRGRHEGHRKDFFREPRTRPMGAGFDLWALRKDGSEFPVEISLSPLETDEGRLVTAAIRDVTERKRFESELWETNVQLEAASKAKDRFLASMSHELRTPLNAVLGFAGTMLMGLSGPLTDDQRNQLEIVQTNARHLLSIINDLLDVAKIESGNVELKFEQVDCRELLQEVVSGLQPLADRKQIELEVSIPRYGVVMDTDRRSLSQILINLANNAIKFTDEGSVHMELERYENGGGPVTRFSVIDTGMGIRSEDQPTLFEAFDQVASSTKRRNPGTGLGLYISQKLAELIHGEIGFESKHGIGSTFVLEIPQES